MLVASTFLLWLVVAILAVAVLALARQIAALHERVAPLGTLVTNGAPRAREVAPFVSTPTLDGSVRTVGGAGGGLGGGLGGRLPTLLLFVAPDCPVCRKIIPIAMVLAKAEGLKLALVSNAAEAELEEMAKRFHVERQDFLVSGQLGLAYRIGKLPSAVLVSADGHIVARGLVNSRERLESLIFAGHPNVSPAQGHLNSPPPAAGANSMEIQPESLATSNAP